MRVLNQKKYHMIQRDELKTSVMERSTAYRIKVENDRLSNFFSEKTKNSDWMQTLRGNQVPNSLKSTMRSPNTSQKRLNETDHDFYE